MGDKTKIEWTRGDDGTPGATWNPVLGCSSVSPGCDHCYAERQTATRLAHVPAYAGLTEGGKWTGEVRCLPERLDQPLRWRRPRRIFVNSMSDLFHPDVLSASHEGQPFLAHVVSRMVATERHTFQVLTKRPQIMANVMRHPMFKLDVNSLLLKLGHPVMPGGMSEPETLWPGHLWLGTSIESQRYVFRARHLLETPAAVRFLSCEPLLGPLDLSEAFDADAVHRPAIDWVIVGGESGPGARPMHPDWARSIRDQCVAAGVPFLFKQWGEWAPNGGDGRAVFIAHDGSTTDDPWREGPEREHLLGPGFEWGTMARLVRVGKKAAGRELDGRTWDEYPT